MHPPSPYASLWRKSMSPKDKFSFSPSRRKKNAQSVGFGEIMCEKALGADQCFL